MLANKKRLLVIVAIGLVLVGIGVFVGVGVGQKLVPVRGSVSGVLSTSPLLPVPSSAI